MSKTTFTLLIIIILAALAGGGYWFYIKKTSPQSTANIATNTNAAGNNESGNIFSPLAGNNSVQTNQTGGNGSNSSVGTSTGSGIQNGAVAPAPLPVLRELSTTPVGGMGASTTATTTVVRWIDRGTGYVYQASSNSLAVTELSNTTVPMIYQSFWNKDLTAFIFQSVNDDSGAVTNFYTVLSPFPASAASSNMTASTSSTNTQYQLLGAPLPSNITEIALNPEHSQVFTLAINGSGAGESGTGYISQFDGSKKIQIFSTPLTQTNVQWPVDGTIALTTKGYSSTPGFLYFVNSKTGVFSQILANIPGLDTLTNGDASKVLYSASANQTLNLSIYDVKSGESQELAFNTLPEKCVWSAADKDDLLCAVPRNIPPASYPEAWYQGTVSFADNLWEINITTGEVHEIADLLTLSGKNIDAEDLTLDPKENFLYFINKNDLTLWSVSLSS